MPIYEYECRKCKAHIEILQKLADKPLTKCRNCGGRLEKQWSQSGFQFKGSGWYVTDYAGKKTDAKEEKKTKTQTPAADKASSEKTTATDATSAKETASKEKTASTKTAPSSGD
ncbi:MAG TPA: zinc ribbon domain-containing protein [Pyrinomonadaceae bacterium]|jgi:putative FmdB family regulatory protein